MVNPRILHYRDHHNGGKFDGNCFVDTGCVMKDASRPIKIRFKIEEFESGFQYLWGVGYPSQTNRNEYSLKLVRDANDYYLRVTYLDVDYNFTEYRIGLKQREIITVIVYVDRTYINLRYWDDIYGNRSIILRKSNISDENQHIVPAFNVFIGASSAWEGEDVLDDGYFAFHDEGLEIEEGTLEEGLCYLITATEEDHFYPGCAIGEYFNAAGTVPCDEMNKVKPIDFTYWSEGAGWSPDSNSGVLMNRAFRRGTQGTATVLVADIELTIGKKYMVKYEVQVLSGGGIRAEIGNNTPSYETTAGWKHDMQTYSAGYFQLRAEANAHVKADNVVLTPIEEGKASPYKFSGTIFDFEADYESGVESWQRLVFYEKYKGTDSEKVYDFHEYQDGLIKNRPGNYWSQATDISTYIREGHAPVQIYRQDRFRVPEYTSTEFWLFNYFAVEIGDTICIEINGKLTWMFSVCSTKKVENGFCLEVKCEDILKGLDKINSANYAIPRATSFSETCKKWFCNYNQTGIESTTNLMSLFYCLKLAIYMLQYDNLLDVDISEINAENSEYYDHQNSMIISYEKLAFHSGMFRQLNKTNSAEYHPVYMDRVFRQVLMISRLTYFIDNGTLKFVRLQKGNVSHSSIWQAEPEEPIINRKYHNISCDVCKHSGGEYPDTSKYASFDQDDIETLQANSLEQAISEYDDEVIEKIELIPHLWLFVRDISAGTISLMRNSADEQNFIHQMAEILDNELRGTFIYERITVPLTEENSPKYLEKKDDPAKRESEIYQETAS